MSMIEEARYREENTDSTKYAEEELKYWESVCASKENMDDTHGDTDKATYEFSKPSLPLLLKLKIEDDSLFLK